MSKMSSVSIRDLKENLRELVGRASRGERIVVTRYGTPRAVLAPYSGDLERSKPGRAASRSADEAFDREERAFDRLLAAGRLDAHRGQYVASFRGRVLDYDADGPSLVRRVGAKLGSRVFFVGFVGAEEPQIDLPGQELH